MITPEVTANLQDFYNFSIAGVLRTCLYFALYSIVPLLIGFKCKKKLSEKTIAALMVLNSTVIYIAIIIVNIKFKLGLVPNMIPACVAGLFYYSWIRIRMHGKLEGKRHRVIRETAEANQKKEEAAAAAAAAAAARAAAMNAAEADKAAAEAAAIEAETAAAEAEAAAEAALEAANKSAKDVYKAAMP